MPNWMEGALRFRGKPEDILRFFREGLGVYVYEYDDGNYCGGKCTKLNHDLWCDEEDYGDFQAIHFENHEPYIERTHRAFLKPQAVDIYNLPSVITVAVLAKQAWRFNPEDFESISSNYNIDIRGFGGERGMGFCQEFIVINGKTTLDQDFVYDDWDWESPLPLNGG